MEKLKMLLIVLLIAVISIGGSYFTIQLMHKQTADEEKTVAMLTEMEDVTYVQYKNAEETVTLSKAEGTWKCEENKELVLANGYVDEKTAELGKIEGTFVADAIKSKCGLEEPAYSLAVKNADREVKLALGVDEEGRCYAMLEGKSEIYEISEDVIEILNLRADSFVAPNEDMHATVQDETMMDDDLTTDDDPVEEITPDTMTEEKTESDEPTEDEPIDDAL